MLKMCTTRTMTPTSALRPAADHLFGLPEWAWQTRATLCESRTLRPIRAGQTLMDDVIAYLCALILQWRVRTGHGESCA